MPQKNNEVLAALREVIHEGGVTQTDLALTISRMSLDDPTVKPMSTSYICRVLSGNVDPGAENLSRMLKALAYSSPEAVEQFLSSLRSSILN